MESFLVDLTASMPWWFVIFVKFILMICVISVKLLALQSNFAPVDELKEAVVVHTIEGNVPHDFPEGVYIRNGLFSCTNLVLLFVHICLSSV